MVAVAFKVGEKYDNRKGTYEVLSVKGNEMRIRWESGEEITTTCRLQAQIITRMELERQQEEAAKKKSKTKRRKK